MAKEFPSIRYNKISITYLNKLNMNRQTTSTKFEEKIMNLCALSENLNLYVAIWGPINTIESDQRIITGFQFSDFTKSKEFYNSILESDKEMSTSQYEVLLCQATTNRIAFMGYLKNYKIKHSEIIWGLPKNLESIKNNFRF
jgi:hypothetical protein